MFEYIEKIRSIEYHKELIQQGAEERLANALANRESEESRKNQWDWAILSLIFRRTKKARLIQAKLN